MVKDRAPLILQRQLLCVAGRAVRPWGTVTAAVAPQQLRCAWHPGTNALRRKYDAAYDHLHPVAQMNMMIGMWCGMTKSLHHPGDELAM